ncbi:MAG: hypothetical protein WCD59_21770 [Pseudolabrys sp.]
MKDQLITILEAIRLAKAELRTHNSRPVKNAPRTLKRLEQILFNENVTRALGLLSPDVDGPDMVPDQHKEYSP